MPKDYKAHVLVNQVCVRNELETYQNNEVPICNEQMSLIKDEDSLQDTEIVFM